MTNRTGRVAVVGALVAVIALGCSKTETTAPATRPPRTTTTTAVSTCEDDPVYRDDDIPAGHALLDDSQLPSGDWAGTSACRWSTSGQDLLSVPECAALTGDPSVSEEQRSGYARKTWVEANGELRLDQRSELYLSRRKPELVQVAFTSPGVADCFQAAMRAQAAHVPGTTITDIDVTRYDVGLSAAELGLDFVGGVSIAMTVESDGKRVPMAIRVLSLRVGGGLVTMTVTGEGSRGTLQDLDALDLVATVRAAAQSFRASFGLGPP